MITDEWIFTSFRAIFFPFNSRIRSMYVTIISLAIILCPLVLQTYFLSNMTIYKYINSELSYHNNKTVYIEKCAITYKRRFSLRIIIRSIGIWMPAIIIILTHIMMFCKLKKEARIRSQSTSSNTSTQMQQISKTFLVTVIVFLVCLLPWSIIQCLRYSYNSDIESSPSFKRMSNYSFTLANLNSCLNPFIYSKIHQKIWRWVTSFHTRYFKESTELTTNTFYLNFRAEKMSADQKSTETSIADIFQEDDDVRNEKENRGEKRF